MPFIESSQMPGTAHAMPSIHLSTGSAAGELPAATLPDSEGRFQLLMDAVTDYAIYLLDASGRVVTWNAGAERSKGYTANEVQGKHFSMFFLPEDVAAGEPERELALAASEGRFAVEGWRLRKDGVKFWAQITLTAIYGTRRELRGFAKVTRDMSAQKAVEEANRSRTEQLELNRIILENVSEYVIFSMDPKGEITSWNNGAVRASGTPAAEMLGRPFSVFFSPEDVASGVPEGELAEAALAGQVAVDGWRYTPGGKPLWSSSVLSSVRDEDGVLTGFVRVARVMTRQKEAEDGLRRLNGQLERYRIIIENIKDHMIFTLDKDGRFDSWSPGAAKLLGYTEAEALGQQYSLIFTAEDRQAAMPQRELETAAREGHCTSEGWRMRMGGESFWTTGETTAIRDSAGQVGCYVRVARDMTRQKRAEEALSQQAADLEVRVAERTQQLESTVDELRRKNDEVEAMASITARDLEEKRVMLNEIHHRVKNNLQVVQSLLKMSVRSLPDGDARTVTMATAQRVFAMAMVHERLYQTKDLGGISASNYLRDLFAGVADSNVALNGQVRIDLACDNILLNLDFAIPFSLLVNELLSNCLKHAFPEGRRGSVRVSIQRMPNGVKLLFKDDGVGLREGFDPAKSTSMGLKLASSLARQLGGVLKFSSDSGCQVETVLARI